MIKDVKKFNQVCDNGTKANCCRYKAIFLNKIKKAFNMMFLQAATEYFYVTLIA